MSSKYQGPPLRTLTKEEAAWVGAMVEAEGSIQLRGRRVINDWVSIGAHTKHRLGEVDVVVPRGVCVYSTEIETIATVLRLVGGGTVYYREPRPDYISPRGKQAFASKPCWQWVLKHKEPIITLLRQIHPYLTSKRWLAHLVIPIAGASCHPSHVIAPRRDPRAIQRHHKWAHGTDPSDDDAVSGSPWRYLKIQYYTPTTPNQRHLLHGGPESGMPCTCVEHPSCNEQTRITGEMNGKDILQQEGVELVNRDMITEADWTRLSETTVVILTCPKCLCNVQFNKAFLPQSQ